MCVYLRARARSRVRAFVPFGLYTRAWVCVPACVRACVLYLVQIFHDAFEQRVRPSQRFLLLGFLDLCAHVDVLMCACACAFVRARVRVRVRVLYLEAQWGVFAGAEPERGGGGAHGHGFHRTYPFGSSFGLGAVRFAHSVRFTS